ncbi:hypothetical protein PHAVU_002G272304 [Phaseolus vulgaris]|uniref:Uncharacterized protein n=1 Tax=Phaseolus vulgaris TaxID=3885 RepID=V7D3L2_PHAVU|nr:hypothetical protein PHAVU_L011100g [Phaseolus vulgaris]ESW35846.1 hypothetical protein PHAVU_L011100g [Phaseolus vulgaris]
MIEFLISNARYDYVHDWKYPFEVVERHHIVSRRSNADFFFFCVLKEFILSYQTTVLPRHRTNPQMEHCFECC